MINSLSATYLSILAFLPFQDFHLPYESCTLHLKIHFMADTRKKYEVGKPMPGFKPGQPPYVVGPDKTFKFGNNSFTVHIKIDRFGQSGKWNRMVNSFHLSFKGITPQPVGKW